MSWTLIEHQALTSSVASVTLGSGGTPMSEWHNLPHRYYLVDTIITDEGCWVLPEHKRTAKNYTRFYFDGTSIAAHRYMYEFYVGDIPETMMVDHNCHNEAVRRGECNGGDLCEHRACFNPQHLRLVTNAENQVAGVNGYWNKATCPNGHERTEANTMYSKRPGGMLPQCRLCRNERSRKWMKAKWDMKRGEVSVVDAN